MLNGIPLAMLAAAAEAGEHGAHEETLADVIMHHISNASMGVPLLDEWAISKAVVMMLIASVTLIVVVGAATRKSALGSAPKGVTNALEFIVVFIRDQIAVANMGEKYGRAFTPFLCTLFLFILTCNLLGMVPGGYTATSNLNVTMTLALITLMLIVASGVASQGLFGYVKHFVPPGTPLVVAPLVFVIEILSLLVKPVALTIRLGANMTAGHIVILVMLGFIFVFKSLLVAPLSLGLAVAIYLLEIIVALIQAYVFTLLTSLFIGMVVHESH